MILGLDPSYSGFGVAVATDDYEITHTEKISIEGVCYTNIVENHGACSVFTERLNKIISECPDDNWDVIIEYPAFATRSGAYLAILNGYLAAGLRNNSRVRSITYVPPTACNSFTKNSKNSKSYLVNYCKDRSWIDKRTSHDECTAIIFVKLLKAIRQKEYKNAFFIWNRK